MSNSLSVFERFNGIQRLNDGEFATDIGNSMGVSDTTILHARQKWIKTGSIDRKKGFERKRSWNDRVEDRQIKRWISTGE